MSSPTIAIPQEYLYFDPPITLDLRAAPGGVRPVRPRVVMGAEEDPGEPVPREFDKLPVSFGLDSAKREIRAHLPPIPHPLVIYGPEDFRAAAGDEQEDHAARVEQILGDAPAEVLQALIDEGPLPDLPPRVPRVIENWRAKVVLGEMGLLDQVEAVIAGLPAEQKPVVEAAWAQSNLSRTGPTVLAVAQALGLTDQQVDEIFIAAEAIDV